MKIASADVAMTSHHSYTESNASSESLKTWVDKERIENDTLEISEQAKYLQLVRDGNISRLNGEEDSIMKLSESDKRKIELIQSLFQSLTGKKIKFLIPKQLEIRDANIELKLINSKALETQKLQQPLSVGWGLIYNKSVTYHESESTSFRAKAAIKTEDGREIKIDFQLNLSREFMSKNEINLRAGDALQVDPLVINFSAASANVTGKKIQFDIDANGTVDQISFAGPGSGFLSLDLNNDGIINDGKELFGPSSGNGFSDLANYDSDRNGWIDENDAIYDKLRIWTKDTEGNDYLLALGEKGIGAIYLGNVSTSFTLKNSGNQTEAQLQRTGIFLRENGTVGTVQHVDLVI